jgi:hypothetical protein
VNKNAIPTVIRGTSIVPGSRLYFIPPAHSVFDEPMVNSRVCVATNGESFAFARESFRNKGGPFAYVDQPERYLVSQAEVNAEVSVLNGPGLFARIEADIEATDKEIDSLEARRAALRKRFLEVRYCQHCNPHHPLLTTQVCGACGHRGCDKHAKHECVRTEVAS